MKFISNFKGLFSYNYWREYNRDNLKNNKEELPGYGIWMRNLRFFIFILFIITFILFIIFSSL